MSRYLVFIPLLILTASQSCQQEKYIQGKRIYEAYCLQCHMADGSGLGQLYPALSESSYLKERIGDLPCLIRNGKHSTELSTISMPAHQKLREAELSNLINYINHQWGDHKGMPLNDLKKALEQCPL